MRLEAYDPSSPLSWISLSCMYSGGTLPYSARPAPWCLSGVRHDWVETKTDGLKLLQDFRRVVPSRIDGVKEPLRVFSRLFTSACRSTWG